MEHGRSVFIKDQSKLTQKSCGDVGETFATISKKLMITALFDSVFGGFHGV
jgi:hypothetical protein